LLALLLLSRRRARLLLATGLGRLAADLLHLTRLRCLLAADGLTLNSRSGLLLLLRRLLLANLLGLGLAAAATLRLTTLLRWLLLLATLG